MLKLTAGRKPDPRPQAVGSHQILARKETDTVLSCTRSAKIHEQAAELDFPPPVFSTQFHHETVLSRHSDPHFTQPIARFQRYQRRTVW